MQLIFDFGNTVQKCAVFNGDELIFLIQCDVFNAEDVSLILNQFDVKYFIISSVTEHHVKIANFLSGNIKGFILDKHTALPLKNNYATPETLGYDRLANAVGAWGKFPNQNILIIDMGTCIKYDFVHESSAYLGGAISPGLQMRFNSLHHFTAKLPLLNTDMLKSETEIALTGNSTSNSILSGVVNGILFEVNGAIQAYEKKQERFITVLTGGDASFFENHLKSGIFALPNLTMFGLHKILDYNINHI